MTSSPWPSGPPEPSNHSAWWRIACAGVVMAALGFTVFNALFYAAAIFPDDAVAVEGVGGQSFAALP